MTTNHSTPAKATPKRPRTPTTAAVAVVLITAVIVVLTVITACGENAAARTEPPPGYGCADTMNDYRGMAALAGHSTAVKYTSDALSQRGQGFYSIGDAEAIVERCRAATATPTPVSSGHLLSLYYAMVTCTNRSIEDLKANPPEPTAELAECLIRRLNW